MVIDTAKFCNKCGSKMKEKQESLFCTECGAKIPRDSLFCIECGSSVSNDKLDSIDFGALNDLATNQLYEKDGLRVENGVLTGYIGKKRNVVIPGSIEEIFDRAFENNDFVTTVEIEEGVRVIGRRVFANCRSLTRMSIPASVDKVYDDAFYGTRLNTLILSRVDLHLIKMCLSETGKGYFNGAEVNSYISKKFNRIEVDIKAIEDKSEKKRKAEDEARRNAIEKARLKAEMEAKKKAEEEEIKRQAEAKLQREKEERRIAEEKERQEAERKRRLEQEERDKWRVGASLKFGSYARKMYGEKAPIEWVVLANEKNRALLISKNSLCDKHYNDNDTDITWENCSLRKWLNSEFINNAFNDNERRKIQTVALQNPNNSAFGTRGGGSTSDRVFLLSIDEAHRYFTDDKKRKLEYSMWWLRSPGISQRYAALVDRIGGISSSDAFYSSNGVRPAIWVEL